MASEPERTEFVYVTWNHDFDPAISGVYSTLDMAKERMALYDQVHMLEVTYE